MRFIIYFMVALLATTVGASTGMGGGVIMKPVLDMLGHYDVSTINVLSSLTVLSMSLVSVGKHVKSKTKVDFTVAIPLAIGAVVGGIFGDMGILAIVGSVQNGKTVVFIQNIILSIIILLVFIYMQKKHLIKPLGLSGVLPACFVGIFLGALSSFLGIGGGPANIALIIFVFGMPTKLAAVSSLVIILFAQLAKFTTLMVGGGLGNYNLQMLPVMIIGAIIGGLIGSKLNTELPEKKVEYMFNGVQGLVLLISILNIIRNVP